MAKRTALVTGGNRGIGLEICRGLAARGLAVVVAARHETDGRRAEAELGAQGLEVAYYPLDVSDPQAIERCRTLLEKDRVAIDVLVITRASIRAAMRRRSIFPRSTTRGRSMYVDRSCFAQRSCTVCADEATA